MSETAPQRFVNVLAPALRQAASIARALEGRVQNQPKLGESTAVKAAMTIADSAAQEAILVPLLEHFPDVALRAEEDTPSVAHFPADAESIVVVDPIDGTLRCYLEAGGPYAIMVGLAVAGRYEAALVALPREGLFFDAVSGGPARIARAGRQPKPARAKATGPRVLVSPNLPESVRARLRERGFEPASAAGGAISVAPLIPGVCAGLRVSNSPAGISIRGRIGLRIAREAGALVERGSGGPFPESMDAPAQTLLLAARAEDLAALRSALGTLV